MGKSGNAPGSCNFRNTTSAAPFAINNARSESNEFAAALTSVRTAAARANAINAITARIHRTVIKTIPRLFIEYSPAEWSERRRRFQSARQPDARPSRYSSIHVAPRDQYRDNEKRLS